MAERISSQTTVWRNARKRVRKANPTVEKSNQKSSEVAPDFRVENHGSTFLLTPLTPAAKSWVRYIHDIVRGLLNDALAVK